MATPHMQRSVPAVLQDIIENVQEIMRSEICLVKAELKEAAAKAAKPITTLGVGIAVALYGGGFLLLAAVYGLSRVMPDWEAAALVGALSALVGLIIISSSRKKLRPADITSMK